jgi:hypothetical protein
VIFLVYMYCMYMTNSCAQDMFPTKFNKCIFFAPKFIFYIPVNIVVMYSGTIGKDNCIMMVAKLFICEAFLTMAITTNHNNRSLLVICISLSMLTVPILIKINQKEDDFESSAFLTD